MDDKHCYVLRGRGGPVERVVNVNAWTPCGGPVLGAGGEPKENYIYKSVFTNRCTLGHAEVVEGVRKCQPCFFVPCAVQPMSQLFVAAKSCDLLIPRVPWLTYLSSCDGWILSQHPTYPAMFRQVCHIAKQVPMLLTYDSWRNLEPEYSNCEEYGAIPMTSLVSEGGASMARHSFWNETSSLKRWFLYMVRWPLAKHTTEDTTLSKPRKHRYFFRFCNIQGSRLKFYGSFPRFLA